MKKILISVAIIAVVGVASTGLTTALFSDSEVVDANTFAAGTLDLTVPGSQEFEVSFENMVPGVWTEKKVLDLRNSGSMDLVVDTIQVSGLEESDRVSTLEDEVTQEQVWDDGLNDLNDPLKVEVNYDGQDRAVFNAWASDDYGSVGNDMMTFAFDVDSNGEADYQIQWNSEGNQEWKYDEVVSGSWEDDFSELPSEFTAGRNGRHFWLKVPVEELGGYDSEYKFGVDSNGQESGKGQTFYSTTPEKLWYNGDNYVSSDNYVQMSTKSAHNVGAGNFAKKVNVRVYDNSHPNTPIREGNLWDFYTNGGEHNIIQPGEEITIEPGQTRGYYRFEFQLDSNVDNDFQGDGIKANMQVGATQEE